MSKQATTATIIREYWKRSDELHYDPETGNFDVKGRKELRTWYTAQLAEAGITDADLETYDLNYEHRQEAAELRRQGD